MLITRRSILSGIERTFDLNVTEEQLIQYYEECMLAQVAFPNLTEDERKFIMTGITKDEWEKEFKDD